jgi:hypothetical protein
MSLYIRNEKHVKREWIEEGIGNDIMITVDNDGGDQSYNREEGTRTGHISTHPHDP